MITISVDGLTKRFGRIEALKDVSFAVHQGETVVLWGPNGAGKTTVLRCLLGILPFQGELRVLDLDISTQGKQVRSQVGYVPQEIRLHQDQSVLETVLFYARLKKVGGTQAKKLIQQWGLDSTEKQMVGHLSGGMKQKLALIIALLSNPAVLFLDESTSHLDLRTRYEFVTHLEMLKQSGKTILLCSHRLSEVGKLADRIIMLEQGKKVREGRPDEVKNSISDTAVLSLMMEEQYYTKATELLNRYGVNAKCNGACVWVEVPLTQKAELFRLLHEASIPIVDFELETERLQTER